MAFTAYRTWVASETLTAALLNAQIRDNGNLTPAALATTKGDTFVATAANAISRLAVGGDGALLVADSAAATGVRWSNTAKTAAAGVGIGVYPDVTVTAAANSDALYGELFSSTFAKGAYTGLTAIAIGIGAPAATGAGTIANAYSLYINPPTIGTTNWPLYIASGNARLGDGIAYVNDTSNANMTTGLTINQGAADNEVLALKSSDVAHGMTSLSETDTYGYIGKASATTGGVALVGLDDGGGSLPVGVSIIGYAGTTADTTKSTLGVGVVHIQSGVKSGTTAGAVGANGNLLAVTSLGTTRFILDSDGDSHQDVGTAWTNFDVHDDAALLTALSVQVSRNGDPIKKDFAKFLKEHRAKLEALKLVTFNGDGHHFVNMSKLTMLLVGAVRQQAARWEETAARLAQLETRLLAAGV